MIPHPQILAARLGVGTLVLIVRGSWSRCVMTRSPAAKAHRSP
jgi:hypothetical protein